MRIPRFPAFDWVAFCTGVVAVALLSISVAQAGAVAASQVGVRTQGTEHRYPLDESRTLEFDGPLGTTKIRISDGAVEVVSDPGPQQICVRQGRIEEAGQWLACLPNEVFIKIYGDTDSASVDGQTY